jgi:rhamnulokinase
MSATTDYLAIDLGASSGRGVVGSFDGSRLSLREVHRFANTPVSLPTGLHWDTPRLFEEVKRSLGLAAKAGAIAGAGIDTWGVDYGLLSSAGELLGLPHHYRDARTAGMMEAAFGVMPRERIYGRTGIQFMALNTIYQLMAEKRSNDGRLGLARSLLFTPDLLHYWLTGVRRSEVTIASTSQLYDGAAGAWAWEIVDALGLPRGIFPEVAAPGTAVGPLLDRVAEETGAKGVTVIAPAGHDTGSAVAAVPAAGDGWAYISSGTWSLVGRELAAPVRSAAALAANFTNEGGVAGTTRFHKNVAGMWLLQECQRVWASAGREYTFEQLSAMAREGDARATVIDPDDEVFAEPGDMAGRIRDVAARTGQRVPGSDAAVVRCILESLALKTRSVIRTLESLTGPVERIHVVGGGSRNAVLCQWTADACGKVVYAGPVEATAAGNVMVQAMGQGRVGSLAEVREVVRRSVEVEVYEPRGGGWE